MNDGVEDGLSLPSVRELLQQFPLAIALVADDGRLRWVNRRFESLFDPAALAAADLRGLRRLRSRDGAELQVEVHRLAVAGGNLLVLDETPATASASELRALRERVDALEQESLTDRLTGLWNRRFLERTATAELSRSRRHRQPLAAVLLDIDHFKNVNDTHGHLAGDAVLRELASLARATLRTSDALVRWGGEEFLVLMPHTTHAAAAVAAENLRRIVEAHAFPAVGRLTISLGVAEALPGEDMDRFFARADAALYRAKDAGRNRVVSDPSGASDAWSAIGDAVVELVWRDSYACGEPTIDAEHEELFRLANRLIGASLRQATDRAAFLDALDRLIDHIARHFADEERILAERGYAKLAQHGAAHRRLVSRAGELRAAALRGGATTGALVEFLAHEVVARHLLVADRDFYPLFRTATQG
ncbi:MAG: diguanylate cyclase [Betaproteobacteria bacterium]